MPEREPLEADAIKTVSDYALHTRRMTRDRFVLEYPHPFLIQVSGLSKAADESSGYMTRESLGSGSVRLASLYSCPVFPVKKRDLGRFRDMITVGRARLNDVFIHDSKVSKLHAYFHERKGTWYVTDCESSNRTFVSGIELISNKPIPLTGREEISLSRRVTLLFRSPENFYDQAKVFAKGRAATGPER